jgi:glycerol-3-phosphate O-acyltransferase
MEGLIKLPNWALHLARRALYCWVRTTVFPEQPQELALDPAKPVCYVLQDQHLSNLLVLFQETRHSGFPSAEMPLVVGERSHQHAVFFLNRKHTITASARQRYAHAALMTTLVHEALEKPALEIQIVPVVILWGRRPDSQESILKALFSETWRQPGSLRRMLTILLHGRNLLVRFSPPISLHALSREGLDEAQALRKLSRVLRVHFRRQRQMAIGPDLSHRNTQIDAVLGAPAVCSAIEAEATAHKISVDQARRRAHHFAFEIASDYSYGTLRALELFLSWLWSRLYDGIELHHVDVLTKIAPGQGIVYVPTHRSHIDYLLLSYLLHQQGLTPPHIAAGANLNLPLIGPVLRRCGAFFLRRSFKGEPLYAAVFHEYLHLMLMRGFPLEYFIEGGRSRSGRTLSPKAGILGMTIRSFIREHTRPLVFIPVYIGYEKVMEGRTYIRELAGKPKQKESLWSVLQSARQIKKVFGKVHVNFGQPLALADFLESCRPGWARNGTQANDDWPREATLRAATELAQRLNSAAVINPANLIALALLATPSNTLDEQVLIRLLGHFQALASQAPYSVSSIPCALTPAQIIAHAEKLGIAQRIPHPLGDLVSVPENEASTLAYFRNNVLHLFALPSLLACLLSNNHQLGRQRITDAICGIYGLMCSELFLRWQPEEIPGVITDITAILAERGLLTHTEHGLFSAPESNSQAFAELRLLGECIRPMLERHFLTLAVLQHGGSGNWTRQTLETDCHLLAQRLSLLNAQNTDYAELSTFSALIAQLIDAGLINEDGSGRLHFAQGLVTPLEHAELVLPDETRQSIRRMACSGRHENDSDA